MNSPIHNHQSNGVRGLSLFAIDVRSQKSIELLASQIKGSLLLLGEAAMDQWPFITGDGLTDPLSNRSLAEFGSLVDVAEDLTAEQPQVVAVQVAGLA